MVQQLSTVIAVVAPAPSKNAVDRSNVAVAPWGNHWPTVPQPLGSISGALLSPDSGLPSSTAVNAPTTRPIRPNKEPRPSIVSPAASRPNVRPAATPQMLP